MHSRISGLAVGVQVEVLWDVERFYDDGRRMGERVLETVWWRGEIVSLGIDKGCKTASIKYEAMNGFKSQVGEVLVYPFHMQVIGAKEVTQLKWRYYESSGNVTYLVGSEDRDEQHESPPLSAVEGDLQVAAFNDLQDKMYELSSRLDHTERLVHAQADKICHRDVRNIERKTVVLLCLLRHKLAVISQKPLSIYKPKADGHDGNKLFDFSVADSLKVDVDCTIEEFEMVCQYVRRSNKNCYYHVDGRRFTPGIGHLKRSVGVAEILFKSLQELCRALGIRSEADIVTIARRERLPGQKRHSDEGALRIVATFLVAGEISNTPSAILICRSLHGGMCGDKCLEVLTRENSDMDERSVWYKNGLEKKSMTASKLLEHLYPDCLNHSHNRTFVDVYEAVKSEISTIAMLWRPGLNQNPKVWTRSMIMQSDYNGKLEVEVPFVLFRGKKGIDEIKQLLSPAYMDAQLS